MSDTPFFSVVIPTYNCAKFLKRSLASVLNQTFQDFEIHVVDNSSTDHTVEVVETAQKENQRIYLHTVQNHGIIAYSRNVGIKATNGKWIAFLDADDLWLPEKLEKIHSAILDNPHVILLCHDAWRIESGTEKKYMSLGSSAENIYEKLLFQGLSLFTSAVSIRRDIADKTGGFSEKKDLLTVEDFDYWVRLSQLGEFFFINKPLSEWHIHASNASKNSEVKAQAVTKVGDFHFNLWLKKNPGQKFKVRKGRSMFWSSASHCLIKGRSFSSAYKHALISISLNPFNWKAWAMLIMSIFKISK